MAARARISCSKPRYGRSRNHLPAAIELQLRNCHAAARLAMRRRRRNVGLSQALLVLTALLGAAFLALELHEFAGLLNRGAGPDRSAFLSSFFALVGCHGLHVSAGLLWLVSLMVQIRTRGFQPAIQRRLMCFSLFWHALDIVWVAVFTIVYLFGTVS